MNISTIQPFNMDAALNGANLITRDGRGIEWLKRYTGGNVPGYPLVGRIVGQSWNNFWTANGRLWSDAWDIEQDLFIVTNPPENQP